MAKITKASDCKCCECGKQAVTFYPVVDPDIPSYPYCTECLEKAMIDMAKLVWKGDKGMQAMAIAMAHETRHRLERENQIKSNENKRAL